MTDYMVVSVAGVKGLPALLFRVKKSISRTDAVLDFAERHGYRDFMDPTFADVSQYYGPGFHEDLGDGEGAFGLRDKYDEDGNIVLNKKSKVVREWYIKEPLV